MHRITKNGEVFQMLNIKRGSAVFGWADVASAGKEVGVMKSCARA